MSIETLLSRYQLAARAEGLSPKTVAHVKLSLKLFASFLGGIDDVRQVQADDLRRFIVGLQERARWPGMPQGRAGDIKLSRTSVNTYTRGVKAFYSWLEREKLIHDNPLAEVKSPKLPKLLPKIYTEDELKAVFKTAAQHPRDTALLELFLDSGLRLSELVGLTMGDIDIAGGSLRVTGKGDKQRDGYFSPQTALTLDGYVRFHRTAPVADDRLFLSFDGHPLKNSRVSKILERIGRRAGLKQRLSPHKLRHTYATFSLRNGCNLEYLRRLMGHTNPKTTGVYLHLSSTDLHDAHRSFSPIRNLLKENSQSWCIVGGKEYRKGSPEFFEARRRQGLH